MVKGLQVINRTPLLKSSKYDGQTKPLDSFRLLLVEKFCMGVRSWEMRKEVSMESPQYNGSILGLQKRGFLARTKRQFFEEFIGDMVFKP
jgi:hypothetical protein